MLRAWCARRLERGLLLPQGVAAPLAAIYGPIAATCVARHVRLPSGAAIVGIGGAVLGGAGKTSVAVAYARSCAMAGARTALVSHAYRAHPGRVRRVSPGDGVSEVGDDALVAAAALRDLPVRVWVGPRREETLACAARDAEIIVVDGLLQSRPARVSRSVLVLNARQPFGSGRLLPAGDLRAPLGNLLAVCDEVVLVDDPALQPAPWPALPVLDGFPPPAMRKAWVEASVPVAPFGLASPDLSAARLGLLLTIARPERVMDALRARGVVPAFCWFGADHGDVAPADQRRLRALARELRLDGWLTSPKCATHLAGVDLAAPVGVIQVSTRLDPIPDPVLGCRACAPRDTS